jgi:hypothetical protein
MRGRLFILYVKRRKMEKAGDYGLFRFEFVNLLDVDSETSCSVEPSWTHVALEMFGLLMLH